MTKPLFLFGLLYVAVTSAALYGQPSQRDGPRYDGMRLVRPLDYREWPFLGSGLGLTYMEANAANAAPPFTNVFVNPSAYRKFVETGTWPNQTVFVLESRRSETNAAPNVGGRFQGEMLGLEAEEEALQPGRLEQLRVLRGAAVFHVFLYSKPRAILRDGKFIPISGPAEYRAGTECLFKGFAAAGDFPPSP